jgi:O-antigen ligase
LLVARQLGWIGRRPFMPLLAGILLAAAFSLTPGLGGIFLTLGLWVWLVLQTRRPGFARLALAGGVAAACLFVVAMAVTPILHPTAPFLIQVPGTEVALAPAVRLMAWIEAARNFAADPLVGRGLGMPAVDVRILIPRGELSGVTDAHNTFLNVAVQCGLLGLATLVAILAWVARKLQPFRLGSGSFDALRIALAFAFLNAFAYQGLGGSFEDSRHLWVLFGLILATERLGAAHKEGAAPAGTALPRS